MKLLVFQHIACEHPGVLRKFLAADGVRWQAVQLDEGEPVPALEPYDALWVMGGPMDVWDVAEYPWLVEEKRAIRRWVRDLRRPFLGVCLGHQLLADALGGTCSPMPEPEIGLLEVRLTEAGREDPVLGRESEDFRCLQWHAVQVARPPDGATVLASSPVCPVQAMRVGERAWGTQYHVELEPDTIAQWGRVPAYAGALRAARGDGALERMDAEAAPLVAGFEADARALYDRFMRVAAT